MVKRAVIVITDGFPVGDTVSPETVIERANAADTSVYVVTMPSYSQLLAAAKVTPLPTPLDVSGIVEKTGGRSIYANEPDLGPLFRADRRRGFVRLRFRILSAATEPQRRQISQIRIEGPQGLTVRQSRPGYQARKQ